MLCPSKFGDMFKTASITDNGTGDFVVNFTTNIEDPNFLAVGPAGDGTNFNRLLSVNTYAVGSVVVKTLNAGSAGLANTDFVNVAIFR